jgi:hypothetical protein
VRFLTHIDSLVRKARLRQIGIGKRIQNGPPKVAKTDAFGSLFDAAPADKVPWRILGASKVA